jgi:hypothetical protein
MISNHFNNLLVQEFFIVVEIYKIKVAVQARGWAFFLAAAARKKSMRRPQGKMPAHHLVETNGSVVLILNFFLEKIKIYFN